MGLKRRLDAARRRLGSAAARASKPNEKAGSPAAGKRRSPAPKPAGGARSAARRKQRSAPRASSREPERNPSPISDAIVKVVATVIASLRSVGMRAARLWLAVAEWIGVRVLTAWRRFLRPALVAVWGLVVAVYRLALRRMTPARAVVAVALVALLALVFSQWFDYRVLRVGTEGYSGNVELVTPAPALERVRAGDAHAWVMLPLALAGAAALGVALAGRPRAARLLVAVGLAVIAIALLIDAPKGLDEGQAAIAYEGARASLLDGFWAQLAAGVVLIACGALLPRYLRPERSASGAAGHRSRAGAGHGAISRAAAGLRRRAGRRRRANRKRPVEGVRT